MSYLLRDGAAELDRLRLQSIVWEEAGRRLLRTLGDPPLRRVLDLGCGALGWLRLLDDHVGPHGSVVGTDVDDTLLAHASSLLAEEGRAHVALIHDDLFASELPEGSFDLVHARFQIAPLGRARDIVAAMRRLVKPGGWLVLEDPSTESWRLAPSSPAHDRLVDLVRTAFAASGGDLDAGRAEPALLRDLGWQPLVRAEVLALAPGHPYLGLATQFAHSLAPRLADLIGADALEDLRARVTRDLARPDCWGTTFTLIQSAARVR